MKQLYFKIYGSKIPFKIEYCSWVYDDFKMAWMMLCFCSCWLIFYVITSAAAIQKIYNDTIPNDGQSTFPRLESFSISGFLLYVSFRF